MPRNRPWFPWIPFGYPWNRNQKFQRSHGDPGHVPRLSKEPPMPCRGRCHLHTGAPARKKITSFVAFKNIYHKYIYIYKYHLNMYIYIYILLNEHIINCNHIDSYISVQYFIPVYSICLISITQSLNGVVIHQFADHDTLRIIFDHGDSDCLDPRVPCLSKQFHL